MAGIPMLVPPGSLATTGSLSAGAGLSSAGAASFGTGSTNYITATGSATTPIIAPAGTGANISLMIQGKGTGVINASHQIVAQSGLWTHQNVVLSGTTVVNNAKLGGNISGTFTASDDNAAVVSIVNSTDTAALTGANAGGYPSLSIVRQFGGAGCFGSRIGFNSTVWCAQPITGDTSAQQYQGGNFAAKATVNVGGVGDTVAADAKGFLYGAAYYGMLQAGATNWALVNALGEVDMGVAAQTQSLTVGGTVTAGDVLTVTFTSPSIAGSPVAINYTVQSGNTLYNIKNNIISAIQNTSALAAVGVTASLPLSVANGPAILSWPTDISVTVAVSTSPGATETLTLGSALAGASTYRKLGGSIVRLLWDAQSGGGGLDTALLITAQYGAASTGGWDYGLSFGDSSSEWPLQATGTIIAAAARGNNQSTIVVPARAARGIDFSQINFADQSGYSLSMPGFSVAGTGTVGIGNATLGYSSTGLTVDAAGYVGSGNASVVSGGSSSGNAGNYFVGDIVFDSFGGQHRVTSVNTATGQVTGLVTIVQPHTTGALPQVTQVTTGGSGFGLTIRITWVAATGLSLNPTGRHIGFNGAVPQAVPTVSGSISGGQALKSLITALAAYGLVIDGTTA